MAAVTDGQLDDVALAVIIGRAGSRGLPGKNALPVAGLPMIGHSIRHAREASTVGRIVVSTDGRAIARAAHDMGVEVIARPDELADDSASVDDAVRHAVETIDANARMIVVLYANVPVRPPDLIDRAVHTLHETGADSVQSYADVGKHHPWWMVTLDESGRVAAHHPNTIDRRQDLPTLFLPDGGVIAVTRESLFTVVPGDPHAFLGSDRRGVVVPDGAVVDVDGPADLAIARAMLEQPADLTTGTSR